MDPSAYPLHAEVEQHHWWFVARRRIIRGVVEALALPEGARLLEFGSGTGGNLDMLSGFGELTAVELDDDARALSQRLHWSTPHHRTLAGLPLGARYDAAFMLDVLEHLDEPATLLRELRHRLEPAGSLVLTVPAHGWLFGKHDRYLHHRRRYSRSLLREHLADGGFALQRVSSMNSALLPAVIGARVAEALSDLVRGPAAEPRGMTVPFAPINRLLTELFGAESRILPRGTLPFGVSLLALATPA